MKKIRIIKIITFLLLLAIMLSLFSFVLCVNTKRDRIFINGFYKEPENSLDVVLIGSSELYTSYNSPLAWKEYGYTSYSFSISGMTGVLYKPALDITLDRQDPKLVVFEINGFLYDDDEFDDEATLRKLIDNMPWNSRKLEIIKELIPKEDRYSYYFPLFKYHMNFMHPRLIGGVLKNTIKFSKLDYLKTKSFSATAKIDAVSGLYFDSRKIDSKGKKCLDELLQYCNDLGLENVLFVYSPHKTLIYHTESLDYIKERVETYGYDFENFNNSYEEIGIDITKDFYNGQHLNIFGAQKYTKFLGKYITDHYDVTRDSYSKEITDEWNDCAKYMDGVIKHVEKQTKKNTGKIFYETTKIGKKKKK